ncbi:MAG: TIGR03960 family B12-binding radical SAM protein [Candidatus Omnitrophica bacterium]|nr:TIGR03960 family B12-binding radical SAM protein [Candidatus Omnitrophota bacterium]
MLDNILSQLQKPGRYIGKEWNVSVKDFEQSGIRFALAFPDMYEVGMSNLGIRIIYGILNNIPDVACERFFSPGLDLEKILREKDLPVFSLESHRPLKDFDIVGFSLGHELTYSNVLNLLELGGIPLKASSRDKSFPLVIGGGPCCLNPEPLADFFDLFLVGEAEDAIVEIVDAWRKIKERLKDNAFTKDDALLELACIPGVYVPSLYDVQYDELGKLKYFKPKAPGVPETITKRFLKDLNSAYFPQKWLVPYIQITHDRITLEITRGCPNTCRFCQARPNYFPYRIRRPQGVIDLAKACYSASGYEEIALGGLSVSDYPHIADVTAALIDFFKDKGVGVSLPSIKPTQILGELSALIATVKKTGLTFAPEAASERLRAILSKDFDTQEFFRTLQQAYKSGYQHVKLYFMIGLPQEEIKDLDAIVEFCLTVSELKRKFAGGAAQINLSVNTLIPKPHTPLQWSKMPGLEGIKEKQDYLRRQAGRSRRIKINFHNYQMSFLEAVFSRGDRRLGEVILGAFRKGARFDAWGDYFDFARWQEAFSEAGLDPDFYLEERSTAEILPWDFIDTGIPKKHLVEEFNKIIAMA